jgi:hypothetical protein
VHEADLGDDGVVGFGDDPLGGDEEAGELAHAADPVADRGLHPAKRHAIDEELDVLVEQLPPDVEVAIVERPVIAGGERPEICDHRLSPTASSATAGTRATGVPTRPGAACSPAIRSLVRVAIGPPPRRQFHRHFDRRSPVPSVLAASRPIKNSR